MMIGPIVFAVACGGSHSGGGGGDTIDAATHDGPTQTANDGATPDASSACSGDAMCLELLAGAFVASGSAVTYGSANGIGSAARFDIPIGVAVDSMGNVYVVDDADSLIREITPAGVVTTLAGGGSATADGTGSAAGFDFPWGIVIDSADDLYVTDMGSYAIRKIAPGGVVTTLAGGTQGNTNGSGAAAQFEQPGALAIDGAGNLYVGDQTTIREVTPAGVVTTLAGNGVCGDMDGSASAASFCYPGGLAVDSAGNVYESDLTNNVIRKVTPAGVVSTLAGSPNPIGGSTDGTGSAALFSAPTGLVVDGSGNVYVADNGDNTIRKITPVGVVTTFAGSAASSSAIVLGTSPRFDGPRGLAISGNALVMSSASVDPSADAVLLLKSALP